MSQHDKFYYRRYRKKNKEDINRHERLRMMDPAIRKRKSLSNKKWSKTPNGKASTKKSRDKYCKKKKAELTALRKQWAREDSLK